MVLTFCGCGLIIFIHFYVLVGFIKPQPQPCLGVGQDGKALNFEFKYRRFESCTPSLSK